MSRSMALISMVLLAWLGTVQGGQPNPPKWPSTVRVFDPSDTDIEAVVMAAYQKNGGHNPPNNGQFSSNRYAFLFKPGTYPQDVPVGFYTTIAGLGEHPDDVLFNGTKGVICEEGDFDPHGGALCTFWRSAENFHTQANFGSNGMMWAVSQAAPLRRVHVQNTLTLFEYEPPAPEAGYASGGYLADSLIEGKVVPGSQQQWFTRNSKVGEWDGGVWNVVFSGVEGAPAQHCSNQGGSPYTVAPQSPISAEKPFVSIKKDGTYVIQVPPVKVNSQGVGWADTNTEIDFSNVYVASPSDSAATINSAVSSGLHLVLSPGIYNLDAPISVTNSNTIVLGLGFATLVSSNGTPVISVGDVDGVRISGLLLQAGPKPTPTLLQWGTGKHAGVAANPGFIQDVFARVGGPDSFPVQSDIMFLIKNGYVIGDNMWLWRADHTVSGAVTKSANPCKHGLVVEGDNVIMYGLAVEHTLEDLVQWSGNNGQTFFFQSELPYDVTQANFGDPGFVGYRVNSTVTSHNAYGVGVYTFFRDNNVTVASGISCPDSLTKNFVAPLSVFLSGKGIVNHIINDQGAETGWNNPGVQYEC